MAPSSVFQVLRQRAGPKGPAGRLHCACTTAPLGACRPAHLWGHHLPMQEPNICCCVWVLLLCLQCKLSYCSQQDAFIPVLEEMDLAMQCAKDADILQGLHDDIQFAADLAKNKHISGPRACRALTLKALFGLTGKFGAIRKAA